MGLEPRPPNENPSFSYINPHLSSKRGWIFWLGKIFQEEITFWFFLSVVEEQKEIQGELFSKSLVCSVVSEKKRRNENFLWLFWFCFRRVQIPKVRILGIGNLGWNFFYLRWLLRKNVEINTGSWEVDKYIPFRRSVCDCGVSRNVSVGVRISLSVWEFVLATSLVVVPVAAFEESILDSVSFLTFRESHEGSETLSSQSIKTGVQVWNSGRLKKDPKYGVEDFLIFYY